MGVLVKKWNGSWWVFINHKGQRKAKKVGDKQSAEAVGEALRALRSVREAEAAVAGRDLEPGAFVFLRQDGRPWPSINFFWHRCLQLAGVRYRNPEQLRHTFASALLSRGWPLLYVQKQGGWKDANTLLKHTAAGSPRRQAAASPAQLTG